MRSLIARFRRWNDRRKEPRAITITPAQWALYLNYCDYRDRRSHIR